MGVNLDELERLYREATPGEWKSEPVQQGGKPYATMVEAWQFIEPNVCSLWAERGKNYTDGEYIAALHNAFPALLALARDGERYRERFSTSETGGLLVAENAAIDAARKGERNGNS